MLTLWALAALVQVTLGLIGYDCGSRTLNITTLSLLDIGPCDIPENNVNVTRKYIHLLQLKEFYEIPAFSCKIEIRRHVQRCGMFSHTATVKHGEMEYLHEIGYTDCVTLHRTGKFVYGNDRSIYGVKVGKPQIYPITLAGRVEENGYCNGGSYADPYGSWDGVIVQGTVKITLTVQTARVRAGNNKIYLKSGTKCNLGDEACLDVEDGYTFWKMLAPDTCKQNQYTNLFSGYADKIIDEDHEGAQTVYSLSTEDTTFALTKKSTENVCGFTFIRTEHPRLLILEDNVLNNMYNMKDKKIELSNLDIFAYVNSKFVYVEKHVRTQLKSLYRDILLQRCNIERETLKNGLAIATQSPDQFAYNLMKGPGYMALAAGEVVHIVKCIPVDVTVEKGKSCYAELQVKRNNQTQFLTPRTHILKDKGTKINCNPLLPSEFLIDKTWYKILPRPMEAREPTIIEPMTKPTWRYISPTSLATSGIYSQADLDELKEHIMFPVEKTALLNDIAREIHGHPSHPDESAMSRLLNPGIMERTVRSTWENFWEKFMRFGSASAGLIAILLTVHGIKMFIEIFINGYALHRIYGWSMQLLGAIWGSVAFLLVQWGGRDNRQPNNERRNELCRTHGDCHKKGRGEE